MIGISGILGGLLLIFIGFLILFVFALARAAALADAAMADWRIQAKKDDTDTDKEVFRK